MPQIRVQILSYGAGVKRQGKPKIEPEISCGGLCDLRSHGITSWLNIGLPIFAIESVRWQDNLGFVPPVFQYMQFRGVKIGGQYSPPTMTRWAIVTDAIKGQLLATIRHCSNAGLVPITEMIRARIQRLRS